MASAGSKMLHWMTHVNQHAIQQSLLSDLNGQDWANLRQTSRGLRANIPATWNADRLAQCQDMRMSGMAAFPHESCPNPTARIAMKWCDHPSPPETSHAPGIRGAFNVCDDCRSSNQESMRSVLTVEILRFCTGLCKPCTKSWQREFPKGNRYSCSCPGGLTRGRWQCLDCMQHTVDEAEERGAALNFDLYHKRKRRVATGRGGRGRKKLLVEVRRDLPARKHPACLTEGCGNPMWLRHHSAPDSYEEEFQLLPRIHEDAAWGCLVCEDVSWKPVR